MPLWACDAPVNMQVTAKQIWCNQSKINLKLSCFLKKHFLNRLVFVQKNQEETETEDLICVE